MALSILHGLAVLIEAFLICRPVSAAWSPNGSDKCGNETLAFVIFEVIGLKIDLAISLLPLTGVYRLGFPLKQKLSLGILLSLGLM